MLSESSSTDSDFLLLGMALITRETLMDVCSGSGRRINGFDVTPSLLAGLAAAIEANALGETLHPEDSEDGSLARWGCTRVQEHPDSRGTVFTCMIGREEYPGAALTEQRLTTVTVTAMDLATARNWFPWA